MKFDCRSARVSGAISHARARVVWFDSRIKGYGKDGLLFDIEATRPVRRSGYIRAWDAQTESGIMHIDETCWTCGGWLKVAIKSVNELMGDAGEINAEARKVLS